MLNAQLPHVGMLRTCDAAGMRKRNFWAQIAQQLDARAHGFLLTLDQSIPPLAELIRIFNVPLRVEFIPCKEYNVKGIKSLFPGADSYCLRILLLLPTHDQISARNAYGLGNLGINQS